MDDRDSLVTVLADHLMAGDAGHPLRVGIDGPCGSGKSTLARELVAAITARGRVAVHLDSDGFHNTRDIRYRQRRASARGYYENAYNFTALLHQVLLPLGPDGSRVYATKVHDMLTDEIAIDATATAPDDGIVVFDCTFLQRGALRDHWDEVIYLQVSRDVGIARGAARDAAALGGIDSARQAYEDRYMAACDLYIHEEHPAEHASILVDHDDLEWPRIVVKRCELHPLQTGVTRGPGTELA